MKTTDIFKLKPGKTRPEWDDIVNLEVKIVLDVVIKYYKMTFFALTLNMKSVTGSSQERARNIAVVLLTKVTKLPSKIIHILLGFENKFSVRRILAVHEWRMKSQQAGVMLDYQNDYRTLEHRLEHLYREQDEFDTVKSEKEWVERIEYIRS